MATSSDVRIVDLISRNGWFCYVDNSSISILSILPWSNNTTGGRKVRSCISGRQLVAVRTKSGEAYSMRLCRLAFLAHILWRFNETTLSLCWFCCFDGLSFVDGDERRGESSALCEIPGVNSSTVWDVETSRHTCICHEKNEKGGWDIWRATAVSTAIWTCIVRKHLVWHLQAVFVVPLVALNICYGKLAPFAAFTTNLVL